uniref:Uncharacterized protein n=1 Tax=Phlebotomus papatasi TaxID=29031 RepID=A0A1B0DI65_PHLPP
MEIANPGKHSSAKTYEKAKPPKISSNLTSTSTSVPGSIFDACSGNQCASCGKTNHRTVKCYKFRGMNDTQRHELVKNAKLCVNCLDPGHSEDECQSSVCRNCGDKHSTWLHFHFHPKLGHATSSSHLTSTDTMPVIDSAPSPVDNPIPGTSTRTQLHCSTGTQPQSETPILPNVLLATAVVCVENAKGEKILCRALLDSGSQANIITERICQLLKFPKKQSNCRLEGIGAQEAHSKYQVSVRFGPRDTDNLIQTDCFVQSKITGLHPSVQLSSKLPIPTDLVLADPQWNTPQTIDMLIGGRHYWDLVLDQTIRMGPGLPLLKHSVFGWMVVGEVSPNQAGTLRSYLTTLESIDTVLRRFWEIEEYTGAKQQREQDDELAEKMYQETTTRLSNGQFMVHLPFNDQITELESNIGNAKKQWQTTQKIFQDLAKRWKKEYLLTLHRRAKWTEGTINLKAGDVVALLEDTSDKTSWPIGVIHSVHPGKDGKVRMVSVKTSQGIYHRTIQNLMKLPINVPEEDQPLVAN